MVPKKPTEGGADPWIEAIEEHRPFERINERQIKALGALREFLELAKMVAERGAIVPGDLDGYGGPNLITIVTEPDPNDCHKLLDEPGVVFFGSWRFMRGRPDFTPAIRRIRRAARNVGIRVDHDLRRPPLSSDDLRVVAEDLLRECAVHEVQADKASTDRGRVARRPKQRLSDGEREVLTALRNLDAMSETLRRASHEIAKVAYNSRSVSLTKKVLRALIEKKLVRSKQGSKGGYWLTAKGKRRAPA